MPLGVNPSRILTHIFSSIHGKLAGKTAAKDSWYQNLHPSNWHRCLPSKREHRIFIALVLIGAIIILVLGLGKFSFLGGFFDNKPVQDCEDLDGILYDHTFTCPNPVAQEKTICVVSWDSCPEALNCAIANVSAGENQTVLCWDGSCIEGNCTEEDEEEANPCDNGVPCLIQDMTDVAYEEALALIPIAERAKEEPEDDFKFVNRRDYYSLFIAWLITAPLLLMLWCAVNQRIIGNSFMNWFPGRGVTRLGDVDSSNWSLQSGYDFNLLGYVLFWIQILTVFYVHFCLVVLTVSYYHIDDDLGMWFLDTFDDRRALLAFENVWMIGFPYVIMLLWPRDLKLHFMLRVKLAEARFVRIWIANPSSLLTSDKSVQRLFEWSQKLTSWWNAFFAFLYSDVSLPTHAQGGWTTCTVSVTHDGKHVITHLLHVLVFDAALNAFVPFPVEVPDTLSQLIKQGASEGISYDDAVNLRQRAGPNKIDIAQPEMFSTLVAEFCRPFYTYQCFMAWTYFNFAYWHMGIVNSAVYSLSGITVAHITYSNRTLLYNLVASQNKATVRAKRQGKFVVIPSVDLVPGDVIAVEAGPCIADLVLVAGHAVVDESSLTGESMPVHKVAVDSNAGSERYSETTHKKSTLRSGTIVLQGCEYQEGVAPTSLGVVITTGCNTLKGKGVCDILFRSPPLFKFDVQVKFVVLILIVYGIIMFSLTLHFLKQDSVYAWFYAMYVIATALPPLLPSVFVVSVAIAASRLKKKHVICSDPSRLLVAGKVRVCCFDKTGTLTTSGMAFHGVRIIDTSGTAGAHMSSAPSNSVLESAMASCHTLSKLNGELIGAAVDAIMFKATQWTLEQLDKGNVVTNYSGTKSLHVVRRFDFDHHRMTSSVIVKDPSTGVHTVFVKGSAESVARYLAKPNPELIALADNYSRQGDYTLAVASRTCTAGEVATIATLSRDLAEKNLEPTGLMMFRNEAKPDSADAIAKLRQGSCKPVMLTGDHILTGVFIAKEIGILSKTAVVVRSKSIGAGNNLAAIVWVDEQDAPVAELDFKNDNLELAILGEIFRALSVSDQNVLLPFTRVVARTSPTDKMDVINLFISNGFVTSMCGDGGNDCAALRASHVGIALSDSDASVVSPFTSVNKTCMSVVDVLLEGRSALASALACYKYMLMYGQVETTNQVVNAYYAITFSEWNWLFMDGFWVVALSYSLAFSNAAKSLADIRPPSSLLGFYTMFSVVGLVFIDFIFLCIGLALLNTQSWYKCRIWDTAKSDLSSLNLIGDNYESTVIFMITGAQYLSSSMAFNFGYKHRQPWLYNWRLTIFLLLYFIIHTVILFYPSKLSCLFRVNCDNENAVRSVLDNCPAAISNSWKTTMMPYRFQCDLFILIVVNTFVVMAWEMFVVLGPVGKWFRKKYPQQRPLRM